MIHRHVCSIRRPRLFYILSVFRRPFRPACWAFVSLAKTPFTCRCPSAGRSCPLLRRRRVQQPASSQPGSFLARLLAACCVLSSAFARNPEPSNLSRSAPPSDLPRFIPSRAAAASFSLPPRGLNQPAARRVFPFSPYSVS